MPTLNIPTANSTAADLYLDLLKKCLTRFVFPERYRPLTTNPSGWKARLYRPVGGMLSKIGLELVRRAEFVAAKREEGSDWPADAETMIGLKRLQNIQDCVTDVLKRGVPGDLAETGVWRGGACIFMRGILRAYGDDERSVWLCDSFQGLPRPNIKDYPQDAGDILYQWGGFLGVSLESVQANFAKYELLDERVRFVKGWFKDSLPSAPIERLAILRIDGDMYESTMDALRSLYPKLSEGGYLLVDDYQPSTKGCIQAVDDFRRTMGITDPIHRVDYSGIYWQRTTR